MTPGLLKVVASTTLGPRERVVVVEIADSWLVLGVTAAAVSTLERLPKRADLLPHPSAPPFPEWLKKALQRHGTN
jgi:flagellar protein FliO/FliZ